VVLDHGAIRTCREPLGGPLGARKGANQVAFSVSEEQSQSYRITHSCHASNVDGAYRLNPSCRRRPTLLAELAKGPQPCEEIVMEASMAYQVVIGTPQAH